VDIRLMCLYVPVPCQTVKSIYSLAQWMLIFNDSNY
jgi:hypothetical protein